MGRNRDFLKGWNGFEKGYLLALLVLPAVFTLVFGGTLIGCLSTTLYLFWCLFLAKGKHYANVIGIFAVLLYSYVSFTVRYYGEVVISLAVLLPLIVFGLVSWLRNSRYDEDRGNVVVVAGMDRKEVGLAAASQVVMGVGYYFVLKAFGTTFLSVSTLSIMASVLATFMLARRNRYAFHVYIFNDVVLVILWGYMVLAGDAGYAQILLMPAMLLVNDVYATINWSRLKNAQEGQAP
ncbi:MAG: nicotinamide riboside transporter PnuC [Eggerthellaceae bacterium]|nr:nicotinamide riboside transporter PnuC [Eggerthellaceae bacterium]